eukprot:05574.XXX_10153_10275_1 [CDS] Oithona nana genome sequencing.
MRCKFLQILEDNGTQKSFNGQKMVINDAFLQQFQVDFHHF